VLGWLLSWLVLDTSFAAFAGRALVVSKDTNKAQTTWECSLCTHTTPPHANPHKHMQPSPESLTVVQQGKAIDLCASQLASRFDSKHGGFGPPPKFPRPSELNLLLHQHSRLVAQGDEQAAGEAAGCSRRRVGCWAGMAARGGWTEHGVRLNRWCACYTFSLQIANVMPAQVCCCQALKHTPLTSHFLHWSHCYYPSPLPACACSPSAAHDHIQPEQDGGRRNV
jgi:hypothetical protein